MFELFRVLAHLVRARLELFRALCNVGTIMNGVSSVQKMRRLVAETGSSHNNKHYIIWLSSIFPSIFDQMRWFWAWFTAYQSFIASFSPKPILYINSRNFLWSQIEAMSFISERSTVAAVTRRISFTRRKWCVHAWNGSGLLRMQMSEFYVKATHASSKQCRLPLKINPKRRSM